MPTVRAIFVGGPRDGAVETVDSRRDRLEALVRRGPWPPATLDPEPWEDVELETVTYHRTTLVDTDRAEVAVYVADGHAPEELTVAGLAQDRDDLRRQVSELETAMALETRGRRRAEAAVEELAADLHDGLGGLVDDDPTSVTAEVDYAILRSWAPDAQVIITDRNR